MSSFRASAAGTAYTRGSVYCSYFLYSQCLGLEYRSCSEFHEYLGRHYCNAVSTWSTKDTSHPEYARRMKYIYTVSIVCDPPPTPLLFSRASVRESTGKAGVALGALDDSCARSVINVYGCYFRSAFISLRSVKRQCVHIYLDRYHGSVSQLPITRVEVIRTVCKPCGV